MQMDLPTLPGLYWSEAVLTSRQLPLTGVPVFLGQCPHKTLLDSGDKTLCLYDTDRPYAIQLWPQFETEFAAVTPNSFIAATVRGFFENGGKECFVIWLKDASESSLKDGLEAIPAEVDLVCAPDIAPLATAPALQATLLQHCAEMGDRFAILDIPNIATNSELDVTRLGQSLLAAPGSDYGALYGPWLKTTDGQTVPPCGHIAGMYAACDRAPIPQAPANIALEGVVEMAVASSHQSQQLAQTSHAVNGIRSLRGRGVRVWGARTLSRDPQWRYVNVRRLAILIRRWIALNLAAVAFEPNDFRLWVRIERELNAFMQSLWQRGYLQGTTAAEAFRVRCDGETNPPAVRDRGQVITHIQFAPTTPNEFIQLRLIHGETGVGVAPP